MVQEFENRLTRELQAQEARFQQMVANMPRPRPRGGCAVM
jgi:hypothetical protein